MSVEVGTAYVTLVPSMKGFTAKTEAALSGVGKTAGTRFAGAFSNSAGGFDVFTPGVGRTVARDAESVGSKSGGLFSRAFSKAQSAGGSGIYVAGLIRNLRTYGFALSGVLGLTVGLGLKTASAFQQANVAFTTVLGSATKAKTLFAQLVQFAKVTPFNLPNVVAAAQKLLAFGFAAKKIKPILTAVGDAAAGLSLGNDGLDRITVALGQISAKGRLQSDELLQLTEAGVPALRILANQFHITTAALLGYVQKGLVPANKAIPALLSGLETGTNGVNGATAKFGGLMAKQSKTLGGLFSNLQDAISIGLAKAVRPLVPILEHALPSAAKAIGRGLRAASHDMAEFLHGLGVAKDRSKGVTTGFERLGGVVRGIGHLIAVSAKFIGAHAKAFLVLGGAALAAIVAFKTFALVMAVVDAVTAAFPVFAIILGIEALAAAFVYAYHKSQTFRDIVKAVFHVLEVVVGHYAGVVITIFRTILRVWTTVVGGIVDGAAAAFGWVPGVGHKLKTAAKYFDGFRNSVDAKLAALARDAFSLGAAGGINYTMGFDSTVAGQSDHAENLAQRGIFSNTNKAKQHKAATDAGTQASTDFTGGLTKGLNKSAGKVKASTSSLVNNILGPLRALVSQAKQLASSVAQTILGDTGFGAILNASDAFGQTGFGTSVKAIIAGFVSQRRDVLRFRRELRTLERRGLSSAAIAEIAGEGVAQGGQVANALLGASKGQLRHISQLRADTHAAARDIGNTVASDKFGRRIAAEARVTRAAIEKAAHNTDLTPKTISALERAYKQAARSVKPYVRVIDVDKAEGRRVAALV